MSASRGTTDDYTRKHMAYSLNTRFFLPTSPSTGPLPYIRAYAKQLEEGYQEQILRGQSRFRFNGNVAGMPPCIETERTDDTNTVLLPLQLSKKSHPDRKGGDRATFEKVTEAYSILGDDAKRYVHSTSEA